MAFDLTKMIKTVPMESLKHHPKNPRIHNERNLQAIQKSISEFGQITPLVIWGKQNYIIVGNGRYEALKRLGKKIVPIVRADHLTEDQALAYMIADNKTTDTSEFDFQMVSDIMKGLGEKQLANTGFESYEIEPLMQAEWVPPAADNDRIPTLESDSFTITFSKEQTEWVQERLEALREEGEQDDDIIVRILESVG